MLKRKVIKSKQEQSKVIDFWLKIMKTLKMKAKHEWIVNKSRDVH